MGVGVFFVFFSSIYVVLGCPGCLFIEANKMIKTPPTFTGWWGLNILLLTQNYDKQSFDRL